MPKKPSKPAQTLPEAATETRAALLGVYLEKMALTLALMPAEQPGRDCVLHMIDDARELLRELHPNAVDPRATRIMPSPLRRSDLH